ncbi:MAG: hypothetical protein Q4A41_01010 [Bacillota bacterium]|nr:hypothetical protein [Bacillota bacterium]
MKIDTAIVDAYLADREEYKKHWIFRSIKGTGEYLFEAPPLDAKRDVEVLKDTLQESMANFHPMNEVFFTQLFPEWKRHADEVCVIRCWLSVAL